DARQTNIRSPNAVQKLNGNRRQEARNQPLPERVSTEGTAAPSFLHDWNAESRLHPVHDYKGTEAFHVMILKEKPSRERFVFVHRLCRDDEDEVRLAGDVIALLHLRR